VVAVGSPAAPVTEPGGRLRLGFSLPAGSYATVLLAALAERAARDAGAPVLTFTAPTAG
jgi:tRNA(Glu) U13 pseudouridine synthase TruD